MCSYLVILATLNENIQQQNIARGQDMSMVREELDALRQQLGVFCNRNSKYWTAA